MRSWLVLSLLAAFSLAAQQPRVTNAKLETRSASAGLESTVRALVSAATAPAWIGYAVPMVAGEHRMCCHDSGQCCGCALEQQRGTVASQQPAPVSLEGGDLIVLLRAEQRQVGKIRTFSQDCELDGGGLPFYWLTGIRPADSVALLSSYASGADRLADSAISAIALHAGEPADRALQEFLASGRPERLREKAVFWLGAARGRSGYEALRRVLREDASDRVRDKAVFALSISKEPAALDAMIDAARNDKSAHVRGQALFWLAHKAGAKAAGAITEAIEKDPETEVKRRAVFALSQMPKAEGVPLLIQVARTNRNPAVRKQAVFWLGQSRDPRALEFFEEILRR